MALGQLLEGLTSVPPELAGVPLSGLTLDSREARPGSAFVALAGATTHGLKHADAARRQGASCVLFEPPAPPDVTLSSSAALAVPDLRRQLGQIADRFHGSPSARLTVVGVTGTNGKTSTVQLLAQALDGSAAGPAGSIGTLGVGFAGTLRPGERTTPDVIAVHASLAELLARGARSVAMEVSSHALDQGRVDAVAFDIAVFSNLSRDHLDYHGDMQRYGAAKARLFAWPSLRAAVINIDDPFGGRLAATIAGELTCWTLSSRDAAARLRASDIVCDAAGLGFRLVEEDAFAAVRSSLLGRFNVDNLLAVAGCLRALGWSLAETAAALARLQPVPGRMNRIAAAAASALVVVDYAHTPDALAQALDSLRAHTAGRLSCVFGCGGDRDRGKRPQMAAAVEARADRIVLTDDNPRGEDGDAIVADTLAGFSVPGRVRVERDRARAIALALSQAVPGDTVLIAGKGHEAYQEVAGRRLPFDDADCARRWLGARA